MHIQRRKLLLGSLGATAAIALPARGYAAAWAPSRPIEILISFPAGGTADTLARYVARRITERKSWPVVVSNKPGGGGVVMHRALQAARADGHTIGLCASYELTYTSVERGAAPFDIDQFTYLAGLARSPHCLVTRPGSDLDTLDKIRAYALKKGSLSIGVAAPFDWLAPQLGADLGINAIGVPFKGGAEMMQQVIGGNLDLTWSAGSHAPLEKTGQVKVVLALTRDRLPTNPEVPTVRELGSKVVVESQFLVIGSKGLPDEIARTLTAAIGEVMALPAMKTDVTNRGLIPAFTDGAQLRRSIEAELLDARRIEASSKARK